MKATAIAFLMLLIGVPVFAGVFVVPDDYADIQQAVTAASNGDTVLLRAGTYSGSGNTYIDFYGVNITLLGESGAALTAIDCLGFDTALYLHTGEDATSRIVGITFANGYAIRGGAVVCSATTPVFEACVFSGNTAEEAGGAVSLVDADASFFGCMFDDNEVLTNGFGQGGAGIHCNASSPIIRECTFTNNAASSAGGVYCIFNAAPEITDCVFDGNTAYSYSGGAMLCYDNSNPTITDCTFTANTGFRNGGAMILFDSSPVITGCTFEGNESFESQYLWGGGAIRIEGGAPVISDCKFTSNSSPRGGAVNCRIGAAPTISDCLFQDNMSPKGGGMYCCESSAPQVFRCEFTGGIAVSGGGLYSYASTPTMEDCIFYWNEATGTDVTDGGGAVHVLLGEVVLSGCTLAANTARSGGGVYLRDGVIAEVTWTTVAECTGFIGAGFYIEDSHLTMAQSIVASSDGVSAIGVGSASAIVICSDVWGNTGGDWVGPFSGYGGASGNISEDPLFCGGSDIYEAYQLDASSPCAAEHNSCGLVGAWDVGCSATPVQAMTWGAIKHTYR